MAEYEERAATPEEIIAALVHELRQPIRAAMLDAEVAAKMLEGTFVGVTRAITRFRRCQVRIERRVDSLVWLPALLHGDPLLMPKPEPRSIMAALAATARPTSRLRTEVPSDIHVLAAPGVLDIVLDNLITNARRHAGPEATVRVSAQMSDTTQKAWPVGAQVKISGPAVLLTVSDDGVGIPPDIRPHLFQSFQRARSAQPGLGIGLWLSRRLVRAHGGDLLLLDTPCGASFLSIWPAAPAEEGMSPYSDGWPESSAEFGAQVKRLRQRAGWTRNQLAAQTGLDVDTLRRVEYARHRPRSDTRTRIIRALSSFLDPSGKA